MSDWDQVGRKITEDETAWIGVGPGPTDPFVKCHNFLFNSIGKSLLRF